MNRILVDLIRCKKIVDQNLNMNSNVLNIIFTQYK